jgi:chemotaxis regulatin CheY-phosphate phosphatase CheZ
VIAAILIGFFVNHIYASAMYDEVSFRLNTSQQRFDQQISDSETVIDSAASDLGNLPALTKLLNDQLHLITVETERSAYGIMERLQAIDAVISQLMSSVSACAEENDAMIQASQTLNSMLMDILSSIQFQDVTRQQIEHVQNALTRLDNHVAQMVEMMRSKNYSNSASIKDHIEQIYEGYVMEQQRDVHSSATGNTVESEGSVALQKIELF